MRSVLTWKMLRRVALVSVLLGMIGLLTTYAVHQRVLSASLPVIHASAGEVRPAYTGIILGCRAVNGAVGNCLEERMRAGLSLYQAGTVQRLLLTGDHGRSSYDEVNAMKDWLVAHGVPVEHIFLDHAGFDTYDSMVRAKEVFQVQDAVLISQAFHLPRAVFIAQELGLSVNALSADPPAGSVCRGSEVREPFACLKAWVDVSVRSSPRFLGPTIPITGSSAASFDR